MQLRYYLGCRTLQCEKGKEAKEDIHNVRVDLPVGVGSCGSAVRVASVPVKEGVGVCRGRRGPRGGGGGGGGIVNASPLPRVVFAGHL